jgi:hypothetical protein
MFFSRKIKHLRCKKSWRTCGGHAGVHGLFEEKQALRPACTPMTPKNMVLLKRYREERKERVPKRKWERLFFRK